VSDDDLVPHLRLLGVDDDAADCYRFLLGAGPSTVDNLADGVDLTADRARAAVSSLLTAGLVGVDGADGADVVPVPPEAGLQILSRLREAELEQARVATLNAYDTFRRTLPTQHTGDVVEVVTGAAIPQRVRQLERSARKEIRRIDSPPYFAVSQVNELELAHLATGDVAYRVVYARAAIEDPGRYESNILPCVAAGEQARVTPEVPVKLTVIDDQAATVSLPLAQTEVNTSLFVVRPGPLLVALAGLFDSVWRLAAPLHDGTRPPSPVQPVEQRLLSLLLAGASDDAIVRRLGISRRTMFRHLQRLMAHAGATTRFQLAAHAVRHGWI
jgi:DNA-binding CsgD family transcriptional regulator/predicted DNA-binding transcriptional regulator